MLGRLSVMLLLPCLVTTASAGCRDSFNAVVEATEHNYAGFLHRVASEPDRQRYRRWAALLGAQASGVDDHRVCRDLLERYVGYFTDHHLFVSSRAEQVDPAAGGADWSPRRLGKALKAAAGQGDPIGGRWRDAVGELAVVPDPQQPGDRHRVLRAEGEATGRQLAIIERSGLNYRISIADAEGAWQRSGMALHGNGELLVFGMQAWGRPGAATLHPDDPRAPLLRLLDDGSVYLSLPSFDPAYRQAVVDLVREHDSTIRGSRGLIIDLRGNGGGDAIYFPLAPYLLSGEIEVSRPSSVLASEWTIEQLARQIERMGEPGVNAFGAALERMRAAPGEVVTLGEGSRSGLPAYLDPPLPVALLIDGGVGSAAEAMLFHAVQNPQVTTLGEPTRGMIDYMGVTMRPVGESPHDYWFGYPWYFDSALPESARNATGYLPQLPLDAAEDDWIGIAQAWLAGRRGLAAAPAAD